ncbi:MAG: hypothetical protein ACYSSO_14460 [Planctomycetota bacterium]|jgi:hypothetical protein
MRPAENINELIKKLKLKASSNLDKRVHQDISRALAESDKHALSEVEGIESAFTQPNIRITIMKSPITKLAAITVIIIACVIGISLWRTTSTGIALADVLTRIEQVKGYIYRLHSTITKQQNISERAYTLLITQEGIKLTVEVRDPELENKGVLLPEMYFLPHKNVSIALSHKTKTYIRMKFEDTMMESLKKYNDPRAIIKQILSCNHTSLGQSVIDGITVEGFQTKDPAYNGGFFGQADLLEEPEKVDVKIWVDINTFLPVRSEEDILIKGGMHIHEVSSDFRWNVPIDKAGFEPNMPDDYTSPVGDLIFPPTDEENAIKGLRIYADLAGNYPNSLDKQIIEQESKKLIWGDTASLEELTADERTKRTNDIATPILILANFYKTLVVDEKEPAYYGKSVTPKDADKVLMRWKVSDNEYRVIFGDLHAETVTAEKLAELDAGLSK